MRSLKRFGAIAALISFATGGTARSIQKPGRNSVKATRSSAAAMTPIQSEGDRTSNVAGAARSRFLRATPLGSGFRQNDRRRRRTLPSRAAPSPRRRPGARVPARHDCGFRLSPE